jgi:hypothetical protein
MMIIPRGLRSIYSSNEPQVRFETFDLFCLSEMEDATPAIFNGSQIVSYDF